MHLFISAGEPSGDLHAANLVRALRRRLPGASFAGFGGDHLAQTGTTLLFPLVRLAVMWFGRVLINLHKFVGLLIQADRYFRQQRPDAVILIDYPGFHWWVAWRARVHQIPVFYYVPPQLWAWAGWRAKKVRKYVDYLLCSLPFEPAWYHARGVPGASYVGHPYFDELAERSLDEGFLASQSARGESRPVVAILPGSRTQELTRNLPVMLRAASTLAARRSEARFVVACLHERHAAQARAMVAAQAPGLCLEVHAARTAELIRLADVAWAVSGSVGLELMAEAVPTVVLYTVRPLDLWLARRFMRCRYISLVNLLADAEVMPEYLTARDASGDLAAWAERWLADPSARKTACDALAALRERVAVPGASTRAAERIAEALEAHRPSDPIRGPHDRPATPTVLTPHQARSQPDPTTQPGRP